MNRLRVQLVLAFTLVTLEVRQAFHGSVLTRGDTVPAELYAYSLAWILFAAALLVVFLMNFFAMRHYIYNGRGGRAARQFTIYAGSAVGFRASEYLAFLIVHSWLGFDYRWAVVAITVGMACAKFFYYRIVFERRAETCC